MHPPESHFGALLLETAMLLGQRRVCKRLLSRWKLRCRCSNQLYLDVAKEGFLCASYRPDMRTCCFCLLFKKKECYLKSQL